MSLFFSIIFLNNEFCAWFKLFKLKWWNLSSSGFLRSLKWFDAIGKALPYFLVGKSAAYSTITWFLASKVIRLHCIFLIYIEDLRLKPKIHIRLTEMDHLYWCYFLNHDQFQILLLKIQILLMYKLRYFVQNTKFNKIIYKI